MLIFIVKIQKEHQLKIIHIHVEFCIIFPTAIYLVMPI